VLHIRKMSDADLPLGMCLKDQANWNQTEADWRRMLALQPEGCFVAELDGQPVATTTTCVFDSIGWIAMVLVEKTVRGRGIATQLMEHALGYLEGCGVRTARLDATPLGRPVYEKLGFVVEYELARWEGRAAEPMSWPSSRHTPCAGPAHGVCGLPSGVINIGAPQLESVFALDRAATGTDRRRLLERLYRERPESMLVFTQGPAPRGYATSRLGSRAVQLGPAVAIDDVAGAALLDAAASQHAGQPIFLDIPADNAPASRWAESHGLKVQRQFSRMRRGGPVCDQPQQLWAAFGPEKG